MRNPDEVGQLTAAITPKGSVMIGGTEVLQGHRGGKGVPLYEAVLAHAKNVLGAHQVVAGPHSTSAAKVRQKLAQKHGLDIKTRPNYEGKTDEQWQAAETGDYDDKHFSSAFVIKAEEEIGQPLKKEVHTSDFVNELQRLGWQFERSADHIIYKHPQIPRPLALKHSDARKISDTMAIKYAKDAGLRITRDKKLEVNPNHPYADHYRKAGLLAESTNQPKTWTPAGHDGHQMEIGKLFSDPSVSVKPHVVRQHTKALANPETHASVPAISVMETVVPFTW